ncbi:S1C family serine protease [Clostridium sp. DL1XJH146]
MDNYNENLENNSLEKTQPVEIQSVETQPEEKLPKKKHTKRRGILPLIAIGLICSISGGVVGSFATAFYLPKLDLAQNTATSDNTDNSTTETVKTPVTTTNYIPLSVSNIAKQIGPAVVGVSTSSVTVTDILGTAVPTEGFGSGIIFSEEGYILTNYHVVNGAKQIKVIFNDGESKEVEAKLVNYNEELDVAVIKVVDDIAMPAVASFGDSDNLQVGDPVIAVGNPLGRQFLGSVTTGVVSALNREVTVDENTAATQTYIQTDAAINEGNSGGPLVNIYGEVIGINSAKIAGSVVEGLGFAIPINDIMPIMSELIKPILTIGITVRDITTDISERYNIPEGVYIKEVEEFSPGERAGLKTGDVIISFDGKTVKTTEELNTLKEQYQAGDVIELEVFRNNETIKVNLELSD